MITVVSVHAHSGAAHRPRRDLRRPPRRGTGYQPATCHTWPVYHPSEPPPEAPITVVPPLRPPAPITSGWYVPTRPDGPGSGRPAWPGAGQPLPPGYRVPPVRFGPPRPTAPGGAPLASFGERLGAYLLDRMIISGIAVLPALVLAMVLLLPPVLDAVRQARAGGGAVDLQHSGFFVRYLVVLLVSLIFQFLVGYWLEVTYQVRTGQTVGRKVLGIRTVPVDGGALTTSAAVRRYLAQFLLSLVPGLAYLDGFWQLWDKPYRQCLHDKVARTLVIKL
jgi:uncharacterized RDD family membrane protein YckC